MSSKKSGETSYKETAFGIISRPKLIPLEIKGIKLAWDFILKTRSLGEIPITSTFLKKVHNIGFKWIFPKAGGDFRKIDVTVSKHIPPKAHLVSVEMANFTRDLEARIQNLSNINKASFLSDLIELLAWSHHKFCGFTLL